VLARFDDGSAAVVQRRAGAGQTFYIGTHLDAAALEDEGAAALLLALAETAGLQRPVQIDAGSAAVDAHLLEEGARRLIILTNNGSAAAALRLTLAEGARLRASELLTNAPLEASPAADEFVVSLEIAAWGGAVVLVEPVA